MDTIMSTYNGNSPAMPQEWQPYVEAAPVGLTEREYFEAQAMQGLLSNPALINSDSVEVFEIIANLARQGAEALLNNSNQP
jgi:hypothetical protein